MLSCTICTWTASEQFLFIDTNSGGPDTVVVTGALQSGNQVVTVKHNSGQAETVDIGGGNVLLTKDLGKLEIKTRGGDDTIDVSGITGGMGGLGFDHEKLDGKIELKGQGGNDRLIGSPFDDILEGRNGDDTLIGGLGDDIYRFDFRSSGLGKDIIEEAAGITGGIDTLDYSRSDQMVTIDLTKMGTSQVVGSGHEITLKNDDTVATDPNIENVAADRVTPDNPSTFMDTITGNDLDNILLGRGGTDTINGGGGIDQIEGGDGNDTLNGNDGDDRINGGDGMDTIHGNAGNDLLQGDGFKDRVDEGPSNALADPDLMAPGEPLNEASGLVVSRANPNILFTIEDAGNGTLLFANDKTTGTSRGFFTIGVSSGMMSQPPAQNMDWEDLAFYHDSVTNKNYLYIADVGDNAESRSDIVVYRVEEPTVSDTADNKSRGELHYEAIKLQYPGGVARNAETLMVDPTNGDIYIVSKTEPEPGHDKARLYRVTNAVSNGKWVTDLSTFGQALALVDEGETQFPANTRNESPSGGDIRPVPSGPVQANLFEIALKSDNVIHIYRYDQADASTPIIAMLTGNRPQQVLEIRDTNNRESIAYTPDGNVLYTVTEVNTTNPNRDIHHYDRVTNITAAVDSIFGDVGNDILVGNYDAANANLNETKDFVRGTDRLVGTLGDMDFNQRVDFDDTTPFATALSDPANYISTYGIAGHEHGDMDGDGDFDFDDLDLFVAMLMG